MMTSTDLIVLGLAALLVALIPVLLRRGWSRWGIAESLFWAGATIVVGFAAVFDLELPGSLVFSVAFVARIALFVVFILLNNDESLVWDAKRAALFTALVYALLVPHVLQSPIDGDEPYFILLSESIAHDLDLDLANQYASLGESEAGRLDLEPQFGDPVGENGELYSRHEPLFSVLLIPGLLIGGLHGALFTVALMGALLTWSLLRFLEDRGFPDVSRSLVWPAIALAPPVLFYSVRLWSEVPGALAFSESLRAMEARRWKRFSIWIVVLSLLQLRFALIALALIAIVLWKEKPGVRVAAVAVAVIVLPLAVIWFVTGRVLGVHQLFEILPMRPAFYARGLAGLLFDAQTGLLFQAPLWFLALLSLIPRSDRSRVGWLWLAAVPYLLILLPRSEWHGGWSPPLRYLVVMAPLIALSLAYVIRWIPRVLLVGCSIWTVGIVVHGIAFPWRLFQIASGESVLGGWLSKRMHADVSRMLPSLIRPNVAVMFWVAATLIVIFVIVRFRQRIGTELVALGVAVLLVGIGSAARLPGAEVHLEDAHVRHAGGALYPERNTVARFGYRGGWAMEAGSSATFRIKPGPAVVEYASGSGVVIDIDGVHWSLPATEGFSTASVEVPDQDVVLRVVEGAVVIDRIVHD